MRIDWATICTEIDVGHPRGIAILGVNRDTAIAPGFPVNVSLVVATNIVSHFEEMKYDSDHRIVWDVQGPDLATVTEDGSGEIPVKVLAGRTPFHWPGWEGRQIVEVPLRFVADKPGPYLVSLRFDGLGEITSLPCYVVSQEQIEAM